MQTVNTIVLPTMTEEEWQEAQGKTDEEWARVVLPLNWREIKPRFGGRGAIRGKTSVIFSAGKFDGKWWLHVSVAHPEKLPSYMDVAEVKALFVGRDRKAIQVFAAESEHVNIHPRALHLWSCLEGL